MFKDRTWTAAHHPKKGKKCVNLCHKCSLLTLLLNAHVAMLKFILAIAVWVANMQSIQCYFLINI